MNFINRGEENLKIFERHNTSTKSRLHRTAYQQFLYLHFSQDFPPKPKKPRFLPRNPPQDVPRRPCPPGALLINVFFGLPSDKNDKISREF